MAEFKTIKDSVTVENDIDDSIAEIDAMVKRLYKIRKQLTKQKKYVSLAKDLLIKEIPAITTSDTTIDARIEKFKHDGYLYLDTNSDNTTDVSHNLNPPDPSFNIFTNADDVDSVNNNLSILQIKRFLTAVNSVLTQPNNATETLDTSGAYYWTDSDNPGTYPDYIDNVEITQASNYTPGGTHKITSAFPYLISMGLIDLPANDDTNPWGPEKIPGFGLET